MITVQLPFHLRTLAKVDGDVQVDAGSPATVASLLDGLEAAYPVLRGTIRDHVTRKRRPWIRFFVCREDWSFEPHNKPLPDAIVSGEEPFMVVGAIAGG
jgi:molybdopterin synthase sulfur carrier subunit